MNGSGGRKARENNTILVTHTNRGRGCTRKPNPKPSPHPPFSSLRSNSGLMIRFNPYENVDESQKSQVLGGQASLWSEQVSLQFSHSFCLASMTFSKQWKGYHPRHDRWELTRSFRRTRQTWNLSCGHGQQQSPNFSGPALAQMVTHEVCPLLLLTPHSSQLPQLHLIALTRADPM